MAEKGGEAEGVYGAGTLSVAPTEPAHVTYSTRVAYTCDLHVPAEIRVRYKFMFTLIYSQQRPHGTACHGTSWHGTARHGTSATSQHGRAACSLYINTARRSRWRARTLLPRCAHAPCSSHRLRHSPSIILRIAVQDDRGCFTRRIGTTGAMHAQANHAPNSKAPPSTTHRAIALLFAAAGILIDHQI